ncbi:hypothetical protein JX265_008550 [Neoarthrinium moseri]|uniref:Uncharacterized protein n=1 Tax=Neoarthrinium moseri TaxID=1658444 RepID=A0A9P9WHR9_9PEZI|nr:hypothetical protein JX265_008550 [Neoarthrinium moseri]
MCKQYIYYSLCRNVACESLLGQRRRNRYCPRALRARRLGHCCEGLVVAREFRHHEGPLCAECKGAKSSSNNSRQSTEAEFSDTSLSSLGQKPRTLFEYTFEAALESQTKRPKHPHNSQNQLEVKGTGDGDGDGDEWLEVTSPGKSDADLSCSRCKNSRRRFASTASYYGLDAR